MKTSHDTNLQTLQHKNYIEMCRLCEAHGIFIPARDFHNWRPAKQVSGDIPGVATDVTIIATNGILGYFRTAENTGAVLCGHVGWFSGKVTGLFSENSGAKPRKLGKPRASRSPQRSRSARSPKLSVQDALDLLELLEKGENTCNT